MIVVYQFSKTIQNPEHALQSQTRYVFLFRFQDEFKYTVETY
jgi:hypothetical protein